MSNDNLVTQKSAKPTRKVAAGGIGGALSIVVLWAGNKFLGWNLTPEVATAIVGVVMFSAGWFFRDKKENT